MGGINQRGASFESRLSTAFLLAALLWLGIAGSSGIRAFTDVVTPPLVGVVLWSLGLGFAVIGLLGLYPPLRHRIPRFALVSAITIVAPVTGFGLTLVWFLVSGMWTGPIAVALISLMLLPLGFVLFAIACLWTGIPSRTVGLLLLVPTAVLLWRFNIFGWYETDPTITFMGHMGVAVAFFVIGYQLRAAAPASDNPEA